MDRGPRDLDGGPRSSTEATVIPLDPEAVTPEPEDPGSPPRTLHGIAIAGTAACALGSIASFLALITIRWPGGSGRYVMATLMGFGIAFLAFFSATIFTAARDTYATRGTGEDQRSGQERN